MRGKRVTLAPRKTKVNVVVVAARYEGEGEDRLLRFAQVYEKHGAVWSDIKLYDRERLIEALNEGKRVMSGRPGELATDFQLDAPIRLEAANGRERILGEGVDAGAGDDLGVPLV